MTSPQKTPVFLERIRYRQRRIRDAARLLPVFGGVLWALPLLWSGSKPAYGTSALVYIFCVWVGLIVLSAILSHFLREDEEEHDQIGGDS